MSAARVVTALLENDQVDPKEFAGQVPGIMQQAETWAMEEFVGQLDRIMNAKHADEVASEVAQEAVEKFDLDEDDFDSIVSDLFIKASELFPGQW